MSHAKKTHEGIRERLVLLNQFLPGAESILDDARREYGRLVQSDDILDALAAVATAVPVHPLLRELQSIPTESERDARGLPMEMLYRLPRSAI